MTKQKTYHLIKTIKYLQFILYTNLIFILIISCKQQVNEFKAPSLQEAGFIKIKSSACFLNDKDFIEKDKNIIIHLPSKLETEQIKYLMQFTGLPQNFKIYSGNINSAIATHYNNEQLIIYNKRLFASLDTTNNPYWITIFILAHEIGHHLAYNISDTSNFANAELQADQFAGNLLYNMGADSNQVVLALNSPLISNIKQNKLERINAVKKGWHLGYKYRYQSVTPPPIDDVLDIEDFDEHTLLFNSKWKEDIFSEIDGNDTALIYTAFGRVEKLKGIILEVLKKEITKEIVHLELLVLITNNQQTAYYEENNKYEFNIDYEINGGTKSINNFLKLFKQGRRLEFDAMFLMRCDGCSDNITKAKAIYNSY